MEKWHAAVEHARWGCFEDVRQTYRSADVVGTFVVFNVNSFRIVTKIRYQDGKVFIREVMTHPQYDRWTPKEDPWE
ncbi:type II toxin-antitoxin system HigB family toxin [Thiomonas sp. FB-6]|uniref:type II toxin-antitoxin system HigB family toxin n=1 Tax=Thiomonas sp. FB-6 TaxID=1158291 RepID=UPI0003622F64|nr:type II toxin-antitoxin system HigB family toxin [Thiomonas sp. FB-6]